MSKPLNDQVASLLGDILKLEQELERHLKTMEGLGLLGNIAEEYRQRYRVQFQMRDELQQRIDFGRQKLISLELLMLDNSIKELRSTTSQVNDSVKSLIKSSIKLERLSTLLIAVTILLAIIEIYQVDLTLGQSNPYYGLIGAILSLVVLGYLIYRVYRAMRSGALPSLSEATRSA